MDILSISSGLGGAPGDGSPSQDALRTLQQIPQTVATADLSFAREGLAGALAAANTIALFGGDGRRVLLQAQGAMASAAADVKTIAAGIVAQTAGSPAGAFGGQAALSGLGQAVQGIGFLADAILNAPAVYRHAPGEPGPHGSIAAIHASLGQMADAIAAGRDGLLAPSALDLTI